MGIKGSKFTVLEFFSDHRIELDREVVNHPDLITLLQNHPVDEFEIRLMEIATYCGIALDGEYYQEDLDRLCKVLKERLYTKRTGIKFARYVPEDRGKLH